MDSLAPPKSRLGRLHHALAAHVQSGDMPGLVALVNIRGETVVEAIGAQSFGGAPMKRDTIFRIASMTKPIVAAATLVLVEECKLRLDDPVDDFLPELANRRVLKSLESAIDDTVPAHRPITARDLLTFTFGLGAIMVWPAKYPIQKAQAELGLSPGPFQPEITGEEYMKRLGTLPLAYQPGERYLYHTGSDVLGVLIERVAGQSLEAFLQARLFEPLGMRDTGFHVPAGKLARLAGAYTMNAEKKELVFFDDPASSRWAKVPPFASGGGGLVSTVDDYHAFYRMILNKGLPAHSGGSARGRERILSRPSIDLMTSDQLTADQRTGAEMFFGPSANPDSSWGMGGAVVTRRTDLFTTPGRFGWNGGYGTTAYLDPAEDVVGILLTQRTMESPTPPKVFRDFWTTVYQAIGD